MARKPLSDELKSLNKKLIPGNIIICLVALISGLCMLLMPWLDLRIHIEGAKIAEILKNTNMTAEVGDNTTFASETANEEQIIMDALAESLEDVSFDIPVNLYPMKMLAAANGGEKEIEELFNSAIGKNGAAEFLEDFINDLVPVVVKASINVAIDQMFNEMLEDAQDQLDPEELELVEKYKGQVNTALDSIAENPSADNAKKQLNNIVDNIVKDSNGEISATDVEDMKKVIDEIVTQGTNDKGDFDYLHLIENLDIEALEEIFNGQSSSDDASPVMAVSGSSTKGFATAGEGNGEGNDSTASDTDTSVKNELTEVIEMIKNPGSLIAESLDAETIEMLNTVFLAIFVVFIGIPVAFAFLVVLFSLIRIFTKKKRVRYWYFNFILFISTLLIVSLNVVAKSVLPSLNLGDEAGAILGAFSITFLGSGIVNAICWVVLKIFSFAYYRRAKKKIRRQKKAEKLAAAQ